MTIFCARCGYAAMYIEPDEHESPFFENGHYECHYPECGNDGRVTDGSTEGNKLNGFDDYLTVDHD